MFWQTSDGARRENAEVWLNVIARRFSPHPEERRRSLSSGRASRGPVGRVSKDGRIDSWFETAQVRLLTMRTAGYFRIYRCYCPEGVRRPCQASRT
jgi:hypothetical protein